MRSREGELKKKQRGNRSWRTTYLGIRGPRKRDFSDAIQEVTKKGTEQTLKRRVVSMKRNTEHDGGMRRHGEEDV